MIGKHQEETVTGQQITRYIRDPYSLQLYMQEHIHIRGDITYQMVSCNGKDKRWLIAR